MFTIECVFLLQNVFSSYRMCSLTCYGENSPPPDIAELEPMPKPYD